MIGEKLYRQITYAFNNYLPIRQLYLDHNVKISREMKFESLPFTCKNILSKYSFDDLFAVPKNKLSRYFTSSGTTGKKHYVAFTENDWNTQIEILSRSFISAGLSAEDIFYDCIPKMPVLGGHIAINAACAAGASVIPAGKISMQDHIEMICVVKPTVLNGLSFFILKLGEKLPIEIKKYIRQIYVAGEFLYPMIREKLQKQFPDSEIFSGYGISEMCSNNECSDHSGFHYNTDEYIVEIADPDSSGIGEIVFTSLYSEAMPLIRYKTGDKGRMISSECKCGCNWPKIEVLGRLDHMINIKGKLVDKDELKKTIYSCDGVKFACLEYYPTEDSRIELYYSGNANDIILKEIVKRKFDITLNIHNVNNIEIDQWKTPFIKVND